MPTMTVLSATMRRLRRKGIEISRRRAALAPTGGVIAKKPSAPHRRHNTCSLCRHRCRVPVPTSKPAPTTTRPPAPRRADCDGARLESHAAAPEAIKSKCIGKGAQVRVRTRVGTAPTGQPIVFWLRAVVDSAAADKDGCLHVTYSYVNGKLPRAARVAPSDIRLHDVPLADARRTAASTGSSTVITSSDRSARLAHQKNKAAPRPTVAGKKLPLLKKFEKEMKSRSKAITG